MKYFITFLVIIFTLGCAKVQLTIDKSNTFPENPILLNVHQIQIIDESPIEKPKYGGYSDHESPFNEPIQSQFKKSVAEN